jgi:hypothetical protein
VRVRRGAASKQGGQRDRAIHSKRESNRAIARAREVGAESIISVRRRRLTPGDASRGISRWYPNVGRPAVYAACRNRSGRRFATSPARSAAVFPAYLARNPALTSVVRVAAKGLNREASCFTAKRMFRARIPGRGSASQCRDSSLPGRNSFNHHSWPDSLVHSS